MTGGYGKYGKLVHFRLPIEDYEALMKRAHDDDRPTTYYLRAAVHQYLQGEHNDEKMYFSDFMQKILQQKENDENEK